MSIQEFNHKLTNTEKSLKYFAFSLSKDPDDAKDLVQETFLKAIKYRDKYVSDTNMKAWLFTILKNTHLNNINKLSSKNTIHDESETEYLIKNTLSDNYSTENLINKSDLELKISQLNDEQRIPFMRYMNGYKYKEIADELNMPIGTIKSRIYFARKTLSSALEEYKY